MNTTETVPYLMGDSDLTSECVRSANSGTEIHDQAARAIAGRLANYSGEYLSLAAFAARGDYNRGALLAELSDWIAVHYTVGSERIRRFADHLGTYLINRRAVRNA